MFSRVVTIAAVVMLAVALVGGSAYILLNETGAESSHQTQAHAGAGGAICREDGQGARAQGTGNRSEGWSVQQRLWPLRQANGETLLRDETGRPLWAGQGRRGK